MKKIETKDLEILRGHFSAIGRSIPSKRSRTGYISRKYVYLVVNGIVAIDNPTTRAIIQKAEKIINTLKA